MFISDDDYEKMQNEEQQREEQQKGIARAIGFIGGYALGNAAFGTLRKKIETNNKKNQEELIKASMELENLLNKSNKEFQDKFYPIV